MRHHFQRRSEDHNQCSLINIYIGIYILFFHKTSSALTLTLLSFAMSQVTNRGYLGSKGANKGFLSEEQVFISQSLTDISEGVPFTDSLGEKKKKVFILVSEKPDINGVFSPRSDQFYRALQEI